MAKVSSEDVRVDMENPQTVDGESSQNNGDSSCKNSRAVDFLSNMEDFLELSGNYWPCPALPSHFRSLPGRRKAAILVGRVNTVVYFLVSCVNLGRWVLLLSEEKSFTGRMAMTTMLMILAIYSLAYFLATVRNLPNNYPRFRRTFRQVVEDGSFCCLLPSTTRTLVVFHLFPAVWTVVAMWKSLFGSEVDMMTSIRLYPLRPGSWWMVPAKVVYCYLNILSGVQSVQLMAVIAVSSLVISRHFSGLETDVGLLSQDHGDLAGDEAGLERLRVRHQELSHLVSVLDVVVRGPVFLHYASTLAYVCLLLYCASQSLLSTGSLAGAGASVLAVAVWVSFLTGLGARVHETAHSVRENLCKFNASKLSQAGFQSLSLFLAQVSGPPIGFTALGLFTIDRTVFLTVAGTLVTYALVLFQFNTGGDSGAAAVVTTTPALNATVPLV